MQINKEIQTNIYSILGIDKLPESEQQAIINELGQAVFESAVFRFLFTLDDWSQESFQSWIETHSMDGDLLEKLVALYPTFGNILTEEILALKNDSN